MKLPNSTLLLALEQAKQDGYADDLTINEDGQVMSGSQEIPNPQILEVIQCISCGASLYLIAGEGTRGTWVHHWEL